MNESLFKLMLRVPHCSRLYVQRRVASKPVGGIVFASDVHYVQIFDNLVKRGEKSQHP